MKFAYTLSLVLSMLCSNACERAVMTRGYALEFSDFSKILIGTDNVQTVFEKVGSPTIRSSVENEKGGFSWYYVYKRTEKNGFLDPKVLEQKTVVVSFDTNGIVRSVVNSSDEKQIDLVKDQTVTEGKGTGILNETFGGLGKYRKRYQKD